MENVEFRFKENRYLTKTGNLKFIKCGNSNKKENSSSLIIHEN